MSLQHTRIGRSILATGIFLLLISTAMVMALTAATTPALAENSVTQDFRPTPMARTPVPITPCPTTPAPTAPAPTTQPTTPPEPTATPTVILLPVTGSKVTHTPTRTLVLGFGGMLLLGGICCMGVRANKNLR